MNKRTAVLVPFGDEALARLFVKELWDELGYRARTVHVTKAMILDYDKGDGPEEAARVPQRPDPELN